MRVITTLATGGSALLFAQDAVAGVRLARTTSPVESSYAGQVIENLDVYVESGNAITVTHDNVVIRNVRVHHRTGDGINVSDASNVQILNSEIINADQPKGISPETSDTINNIETYRAPGLTVRNVTVRGGSAGILVLQSPRTTISFVDGYNFRGPFPRGQFVQFGWSPNSVLTNFYTYNDPKNSWVEDNVNVYASAKVRIENGVIDGNNSTTGAGVMFENGSTDGRVYNVDVVHMGNGGFSSYADNVVFDRVRAFSSIFADQGRGMSASKGLNFGIVADGIRIVNSTYTKPGNPRNIAWDGSRAVVLDLKEDARASPMTPFTNHHDWLVEK